MSNEAMVRHIVGVEGAEALIRITEGAWSDYIGEGVQRFHRSTRAAIVWDYMVQRADTVLTSMEGVARCERHERPLYVLRDMIMMRPKMHDRQTATRNYPTKAQRQLRKNGGYFEDLAIPNVVFGYKLDAAEAGIEQCVITSPADDWIIDLHDLASGNLAPTSGMFDMPELDQAWRQVESIKFGTGS